MNLVPPDKNCGICGASTCKQFLEMVKMGKKVIQDCSFLQVEEETGYIPEADTLNCKYDIILYPIPGEPTTRKTVLPFRPDLTEKWNIKKGDIVIGRPTGQGCPVQHVLKVDKANYATGIIEGHIVGPKYSIGNDKIFDIESFTVISFEGIAQYVDKGINEPPALGSRMSFLPRYCMLQLTHTGIVNRVLIKSYGTQVRFEHPIIL